MDAKTLKQVVDAHRLWLKNDPAGIRADLADADLRGANLRGANLTDANLLGANLLGANFGDIEIPAVPNLDARILEGVEADRLVLDMSDWHGEGDENHCGTTHCRAGHAINMAGEKGYVLEDKLGPSVAGVLIYHASCPTLPIPDFYASNEEAMNDIRERAGKGC